MQVAKVKMLVKVLLVKLGRMSVVGDLIRIDAKNQIMIATMITDAHIVLDGTMDFTTAEKDREK